MGNTVKIKSTTKPTQSKPKYWKSNKVLVKYWKKRDL